MSKKGVLIGAGIAVVVVGGVCFLVRAYRAGRAAPVPLQAPTPIRKELAPAKKEDPVLDPLEKSFARLRDLVPEVHHGLIDAHRSLVMTLAKKHCDPALVASRVRPMLDDLAETLEADKEIDLDKMIDAMTGPTEGLLKTLAVKDLGSMMKAGEEVLRAANGSRFH